ncbi:hypothetical protein Busp01_29630 [Trinickia caryophylli]|uniref:Uncharacterized protein n=2 Tax=Trinickia caryophylli TaxID=28094 RepID=A0A1X7EWF9_TRICW|nr:hypothetical protein C0Z17_23765 [Trinickia caryophylli]GLU33121.1 hypothetical protein Busp01_29630 [Trinickia caryophylli]SMF41335.1 hypothetical protein SAMN06295900_106378 [Trinickia caryophylli]
MTALCSLKARRERKARGALAALARARAALDEEQAGIARSRSQLWRAWRERGELRAVVDQNTLRDLKIELGEYRLEDEALAERLESIRAERQALTEERSRQQARLRQAVNSQEKLKLLLE